MWAGPVDRRITNSGSMAISGTYSPRRSIRSTTVCAAISPIFTSGCLTVVSPGSANAAPGISSKPTTEISCGTRRPASRIAQIEPNAELLGHFADRAPAHGGVRANGLSLDEGDFFVTEIAKMFEGQPGGTLVIQHDVGQTFDSLVSCDRDGWQWKRLR